MISDKDIKNTFTLGYPDYLYETKEELSNIAESLIARGYNDATIVFDYNLHFDGEPNTEHFQNAKTGFAKSVWGILYTDVDNRCEDFYDIKTSKVLESEYAETVLKKETSKYIIDVNLYTVRTLNTKYYVLSPVVIKEL